VDVVEGGALIGVRAGVRVGVRAGVRAGVRVGVGVGSGVRVRVGVKVTGFLGVLGFSGLETPPSAQTFTSSVTG